MNSDPRENLLQYSPELQQKILATPHIGADKPDSVIYRYNRFPAYHSGSNWPFLHRMSKPLRLNHLSNDPLVMAALRRIQRQTHIVSIVVKGSIQTQRFTWLVKE